MLTSLQWSPASAEFTFLYAETWLCMYLQGVYIANQMVARPDPTGSTPGMDDYYDLSDTTGEPMVS
jgi:hypothetical protein